MHPDRNTLLALLLIAFAPFTALRSAAESIARFWLENTITRQSYGPVLNQPGYRFQIETDGYIVLAAKPGQILFSTYPQTQYLGPFDLQPDRIIDLGNKAYAIARMDMVSAPRIPSEVLPNAPHSPSVPPSPHKPASEKTVWVMPAPYWETAAWIEPFHNTKYDWTLGSYDGKRASDLKLSRIGATAAWGGFEGSLGLSFNGEHSDSVLPPVQDITDLRLDNGSGFHGGVGYLHRIRLDERWHAMIGGLFEYRTEKYDLTATVFDGTETVFFDVPSNPEERIDGDETTFETVPQETQINTYRTVSKSVTLNDYALSLRGGIVYEADSWGSRLELLINLWDDTETDGSIQVLAEEYSLNGSRSHPISVAAAVWCYVLEGVLTEARLSIGGETSLRLGVGYEW